MTSHDEQRLSDALRRRAESADPTPLTLDDVRSRARGIRRTRVGTGIAAAVAAVAAVVVPTSALVTGGDDRSDPPVASNGPTDRVVPTEQHLTVRVLGDLPPGDAPRLAVRIGSDVLVPGGDRVQVGDDTVYAAVVGRSVVTVERLSEQESRFVVRDSEGQVTLEKPANVDGALSVTPDRTAAAYVDAEGRIHTWTESDGDLAMSGPVENIQLGAMTGSQTCRPAGDGSTDGICSVVFNRGVGGAGFADSTGASDPIPGFIKVTDRTDRLWVGQTRSTNDGSCSAIKQAVAGRPVFDTCDYLLKDLSPDGAYVTASPPYGDGLCCSTYDILDAATGTPLITLDAKAGPTRTQVLETRWEDDSHVLAVVSDGERWRIVRIGLDGSVELADVGDLPADSGDGTVPVRLSTGR